MKKTLVIKPLLLLFILMTAVSNAEAQSTVVFLAYPADVAPIKDTARLATIVFWNNAYYVNIDGTDLGLGGLLFGKNTFRASQKRMSANQQLYAADILPGKHKVTITVRSATYLNEHGQTVSVEYPEPIEIETEFEAGKIYRVGLVMAGEFQHLGVGLLVDNIPKKHREKIIETRNKAF